MNSKPLVVDLDGTLIRSDILVESVFAFLKVAPHRFYLIPLWLMWFGKIGLKSRLADTVELDVTVLPYDEKVLAWLSRERGEGRQLVLATASHECIAHEVSNYIGLFNLVFASDAVVNLSAGRKRDRLVAEFDERGFDYVGNSRSDLVVWAAADRAYVVNPSVGVERAARMQGNVSSIIRTRESPINVWVKSLRLHQWSKNLLIFLPLLAAHEVFSWPMLTAALLAFISFGLCASSVYILNDLLDLEDDRHHPTKRHRPLAAGTLPITQGVILFPLLLVFGFFVAIAFLPVLFFIVLSGYYVFTLTYSLYLKRRLMVDVVTLACLYTARIVAGSVAINVRLSFWLLVFSMFIFLSLALVKRYSELKKLKTFGREESRGRSYVSDDRLLISMLGTAAGYLSVLVLALYIQDPNTRELYRHPEYVWIACPVLLYWVSRIWAIAHRGGMDDDPIVFAFKDRCSWAVVAICATIFGLAI